MFRALKVEEKPVFNRAITAVKERTYRPYAGTTFGYNDEIRIPARKQEYHLLPSQSTVHVIGKLTNGAGAVAANATLDTNFGAFLFNECRYEINGQEIDRTRNVGIASTMKTYASMKSTNNLQNAGWFPVSEGYNLADATTGYFHVVIPLSSLLGFAEDFQKCITGCSHELVLIRSSNDNCTIKSTEENNPATIVIEDIYWKIPSLSLSHQEQARMLGIVDKNENIHIAFRSWELYELPSLPATRRMNWTIKASSQLEKPRFIIFGFQTDRKKKMLTAVCLIIAIFLN